MNQGRSDFSRHCVAVWNYQRAVRQEGAWIQLSTTREKFYSS